MNTVLWENGSRMVCVAFSIFFFLQEMLSFVEVLLKGTGHSWACWFRTWFVVRQFRSEWDERILSVFFLRRRSNKRITLMKNVITTFVHFDKAAWWGDTLYFYVIRFYCIFIYVSLQRIHVCGGKELQKYRFTCIFKFVFDFSENISFLRDWGEGLCHRVYS